MSEKRQPKGIPTGGQFAESAHDEAGAPLGSSDPEAFLYETTFVESDDSLEVIESDLSRRPATDDEREQYRRALEALDEEGLKHYTQANALAQHLEVPIDEVERDDYETFGLSSYTVGSQEWLIGDEPEAENAAQQKAKEDVWMCSASFLSAGTGIDDEAISAIQNSMYENASEPLQKIVAATWDGGLDGYAEALIYEDGRGSGLAGYNGEESDQYVTVNGEGKTLFLYRNN